MTLRITPKGLINWCIRLLLLLIVISIFVPFSPKMPASGLDPSWALGLNQAVSLGFSFGKEIIFTLGPYSSIYTKAYHPATDLMMVGGSLYLAVSYWICLIVLMKNTRWYWVLAWCIPFLGMLYARDSLLFSYPLLVGLICFKNISGSTEDTNRKDFFLCALIFAPLGLLTLIKGSVLILCLAINFLCCALFLACNRKVSALICLVSPLVSALLFWFLAGQSLVNLPHYFISTMTIASGFTEAMSSDGNSKEIILYVLTAVFILWAIAWQKQLSGTAKIFLLSIFFVFLFVSFKTGFVRHYGHAFIPGTSILLAGLFLSFVMSARMTCTLLVFSLCSWYYINGHYTPISIRDNFMSTYTSSWYGFKSRIYDPLCFQKNFELVMGFLKQQSGFPTLPGTTDIYSYHQTDLIAAQNNWFPRPVFQSYSVFTASLAEENKKHLQGQHAPDNVIFNLESIDERMPSLEDGASWIVLLEHYQPIYLAAHFLVLQKRNAVHSRAHSVPRAGSVYNSSPRALRPAACLRDPVISNREQSSGTPIDSTGARGHAAGRSELHCKQTLTSAHYVLGEPVVLPEHGQLLFATIELKPTVWGELATILFKPDQLHITVSLKNGTQKCYRLIANMAKADFLMSPLIENTAEFNLLYKKNEALYEKMVTSFVINASQDKTWHWNDEYVVHFKSVSIS